MTRTNKIHDIPYFHLVREKVVCNSWYWLWTATGEKFKVCSMNYNCPFREGVDVICGMYNSSEESKKI